MSSHGVSCPINNKVKYDHFRLESLQNSPFNVPLSSKDNLVCMNQQLKYYGWSSRCALLVGPIGEKQELAMSGALLILHGLC